MDKRSFIKLSGMVGAGALVAPTLTFCTSETNNSTGESKSVAPGFEMSALPYGFADLEPHIDAMTMEIHYSKHYAGYTAKLNAGLEGEEAYSGMSIEAILAALTGGDEHIALRNNGGGFYNHSFFWEIMRPGSAGVPTGQIGDAINAQFGSFTAFKEAFSKEASTVFGSGWAWLCVNQDNKLQISSTPNQDSPLMTKIVEKPGTPILGIDVWEHAYYLKHQNKRGDYIENFFNVINWGKVSEHLSKAIS